MKAFSASLVAMIVLGSSAAMAFETAHPTQANVPALRAEIKANAASKLGVPQSQVRVSIKLNPKMPLGFIGNGFSSGTARADGKTINYILVQGDNGKFVAQPMTRN